MEDLIQEILEEYPGKFDINCARIRKLARENKWKELGRYMESILKTLDDQKSPVEQKIAFNALYNLIGRRALKNGVILFEIEKEEYY